MKGFLRNLGWPAVCGLLFALLIIQQFPQWLGLPENSAYQMVFALTLPTTKGVVSYSDAVNKAAPAVANIFTTKQISRSDDSSQFNTPPTLRDYSNTIPNLSRRQSGLGAGVILREGGCVLTNTDVAAAAVGIRVALRDGRGALADLSGSAPGTDRGVLKRNLPDIPAVT